MNLALASRQDGRTSVLSCRGIHKSFGPRSVLAGVNLSISAGEIVGLVGHNGAGKTTLLQIIAGITEADRGQVRLAGLEPGDFPDQAHRRVGLVPDEPALLEYLTPWELLTLAASACGLERPGRDAALAEILSLWGLERRAHEPVVTLSHGMKQKLWISMALLPSPPLLLLDEPLGGLDVHSSAVLEELLRRQAERGKAIIVSSHVLSLVESVCHRVAVLSRGRLIFPGAAPSSAARLEEFLLTQEPGRGEAGQIAAELDRAFVRASEGWS